MKKGTRQRIVMAVCLVIAAAAFGVTLFQTTELRRLNLSAARTASQLESVRGQGQSVSAQVQSMSRKVQALQSGVSGNGGK